LRIAPGTYTRKIDSGIRWPFTVATSPGPSASFVVDGGVLCVHAAVNAASDAVIKFPTNLVIAKSPPLLELVST
jgi:hypothetical protein